MKHDNPSNEMRRNVRREHIDCEYLRGHRDETTLLVQVLSATIQSEDSSGEHFTHRSRLLVSKSTNLKPGLRHPSTPNSSPIAEASSGDALTSTTRLCGESYICNNLQTILRSPRPRPINSSSLVEGSCIFSSMALWNESSEDMATVSCARTLR